MEIELRQITVRELTKDYVEDGENGVRGYAGKLDIRPPYQREFVYSGQQQEAVIDTVKKGFPLNVMYWADREDGTFEVIDGQQRTISLCRYVQGDFAVLDVATNKKLYFHNLKEEEQAPVLDYPLMIYVCKGTDSEKLSWFKTINIAGKELKQQELRNAVFCGPFVTDAKRYFSKHGCVAQKVCGDYLSGEMNRQDYLETVLKWISGGKIDDYMGQHQHDENAESLWLYFKSVIDWVKATFPTYREEMKGIDWGDLYTRFGKQTFDTEALEKEVARLMADDDVTNRKGIYAYVLDGEERNLHIRAFSKNMKREVYERQKGICAKCGKHFDIKAMEADHITPWSQGGHTVIDNCKMLCRECNRRKSNK